MEPGAVGRGARRRRASGLVYTITRLVISRRGARLAPPAHCENPVPESRVCKAAGGIRTVAVFRGYLFCWGCFSCYSSVRLLNSEVSIRRFLNHFRDAFLPPFQLERGGSKALSAGKFGGTLLVTLLSPPSWTSPLSQPRCHYCHSAAAMTPVPGVSVPSFSCYFSSCVQLRWSALNAMLMLQLPTAPSQCSSMLQQHVAASW